MAMAMARPKVYEPSTVNSACTMMTSVTHLYRRRRVSLGGFVVKPRWWWGQESECMNPTWTFPRPSTSPLTALSEKRTVNFNISYHVERILKVVESRQPFIIDSLKRDAEMGPENVKYDDSA
jgi:hypothetical protein